MPTNPDRSCTYLFLRAHRIVQTSGRPAQSCPWWPPAADKLDQHSEEHWPGGGGKIMMTLRSATPKGKEKARWQMVKPRLGIAGRALLKVNCQGVPIITQPRKERKIREHNTDMTETGRQEWNKTLGIRPSLPPFTKYIGALIKIRDIVISQHIHVPTWNQLQLHLQLATL